MDEGIVRPAVTGVSSFPVGKHIVPVIGHRKAEIQRMVRRRAYSSLAGKNGMLNPAIYRKCIKAKEGDTLAPKTLHDNLT